MARRNALDIKSVFAAARRLTANGQPKLDKLARELHSSARSVQRSLRQEGLQFSRIVDRARLDLATRLLRSSNMKVSDVAHRLGYADAGSFSRAFSRWTGQTPRAFRKNCSM